MTFGLLLAGVCILFGRNCVINARLKRRVKKLDKKICDIRVAYDKMEYDLNLTKRRLGTILTPFTAFKREYFIKSFDDLHVVYMKLFPADGEISVPIKVFFDEEDSDFALREAEEFKEKCEEE